MEAAKAVSGFWSAFNIGKIFKSGLDVEITFTNNSEGPLKYGHGLIMHCELTLVDPEGDYLLVPG
jgi:hypothetical protein